MARCRETGTPWFRISRTSPTPSPRTARPAIPEQTRTTREAGDRP